MMWVTRTLRLWIVVVIAAVLIALPGIHRNSDQNSLERSLAIPGFVADARAQSGGAGETVAALLDSEAGISAYFQAAAPLSLNTIRSLFRTIESETAAYIIGSIAVQGYGETEDVHVYANVDGWVLAYYLKADPTAKIIDWVAYTGGTTISTKLEKTLLVVASSLGTPSPTITFYHFQYPNANSLMLLAEQTDTNSEIIQVNLPGSFGYYERSWGAALKIFNGNQCGVGTAARWRLNGVEIGTSGSAVLATNQGLLSAGQLLPDTLHSIEVYENCGGANGYGGLALVYRVP